MLSSKAKSLYKSNESGCLLVEFRDDTTAFDGEKQAKLSNKGVINNQINAYLMQFLNQAGIKTHFKKTLGPQYALVEHLKMIPLESVVRNITTGSVCRRLGVPVHQQLDPPLYELFLKNDALHDPLVNENHAVCFKWATRDQLLRMEQIALNVHYLLTDLFEQGGLILVDAKYEFGVGVDGYLYVGDEISPDSCRIWDKTTKKSLDKDRFRQDLGEVVHSYQIIAERLGVTQHY